MQIDTQHYNDMGGIYRKLENAPIGALPVSIRKDIEKWINGIHQKSNNKHRKEVDIMKSYYAVCALNEGYVKLQTVLYYLRTNFDLVSNLDSQLATSSVREREDSPEYVRRRDSIKANFMNRIKSAYTNFDPDRVEKLDVCSEVIDFSGMLKSVWLEIEEKHFSKTLSDLERKARDIEDKESYISRIEKDKESANAQVKELKLELKAAATEKSLLEKELLRLKNEKEWERKVAETEKRSALYELKSTYEEALRSLKEELIRTKNTLQEESRLAEMRLEKAVEGCRLDFIRNHQEEIERRAKVIAAQYIKQEFPFQ